MATFCVPTIVMSILLGSTAASLPPLPAPLTIGSPSPKLASMKYVKGDAIKALSAGTVYVVEFSGTQCVPCIRCIPHLNALQKKHTDVVFLSIYCEYEKAVRGFLTGKGKDIAIRVAVDPGRRMWRDWAEPACQDGIPCAFIVGKEGRIAWIGDPVDLDDPLARIVADTFDPQEYVLRLKVEQEAFLRLRRAREREEKGSKECERINDMAIAGKLADALADTDKALAAYRDCPEATERLRRMRFYLLANLPGKREEAFQLATELAVEAKMSGQDRVMLNTAKSLLAAAEDAKPEVRDTRLIDLALPLLGEATPFDPEWRGRNENDRRDYRILTLRFQGRAYHLRGDAARATNSIRDAMVMIRDLKPPPGADAKKFATDTRRRLEYFQTILKKYSEEATSSPKERR